MSFVDKLKNRIKEVSDAAVEAAKDFQALPEVAQQRIEICIACPELIQLTKNCKQCGCFMAAKTKLKNSECPLKKW